MRGKLKISSSDGLINQEVGTNVEPLYLRELAQLSRGDGATSTPINEYEPLSYGSILGSPGLRDKILYQYQIEEGPQQRVSFAFQNVLTQQLSLTVTQGAIAANFIALDTLLGPGDHFCRYPTYQELYKFSRRGGAEVSL